MGQGKVNGGPPQSTRAVMTGTKFVLRVLLGIALVLAVFFVPAGTLRWPQAWIFLVLYLSAVAGFFVYTKRKDPGLLKERMSPQKSVKPWDRRLVRVYSFFLAAMTVLTGLDAVRFRWSHIPLEWSVLGFGGLVLAMLLAFWATRENTFASSVVRIQTDRGHYVCSTGPYAYVRHPMYVGVILSIISLPLALGSLFALIPAGIIVGLFILRTSLEDKTLKEELPGYREYAQSVRFRLIPGLAAEPVQVSIRLQSFGSVP
jgi:protein-S-isoprenylcysteine O-methyltransferase Ste14